MSKVLISLILMVITTVGVSAVDFTVVDTLQLMCYDEAGEIPCPDPGNAFHGQDAQYDGNPPVYTISGDGLTVYDAATGLTWVKFPDTDGDGDLDSDDKLSWTDMIAYPATLNAQNFGGYNDWRVPSIKALYSLMDFRGLDPSGPATPGDLVPFIDTAYFDFVYGDENAGERIIDAQYRSSTEYVGTTMGGDATAFGVNFADGRIKGYPRDSGPGGEPMAQFVRFVRGNSNYGINLFTDTGDTVTDTATGLMWQKSDSGAGMIWEDALAYAEDLVLDGNDDWRLPNAKELQSIVDYTRAPSVTGTAAIDPIFDVTAIVDEGGGTNYPFYWSGTTHANAVAGQYGAYVCFGEALGWMESPPGSGNYELQDVHGAGAQRSDPKTGDPGDYPYGHGPQGDVIRIYNFVRCVRDTGSQPGPTPTATPETPGIELEMPATYFQPGDDCYLDAILRNPSDPLNDVPLVVILDIDGVYWFWSSWTREFDFEMLDVPAGSKTVQIIPDFTWPDTGNSTMNGLIFWAAILTPDMTEILGGISGIDHFEFGFGL